MPVINYRASVKLRAFVSLLMFQGRSTDPINNGVECVYIFINTAFVCVCVCVRVPTKPVCSPLR